MVKPARGMVKLGVAAVLALLIGVGAVFALGEPNSRVQADSVAILKSQGVTCGSCAARIEKALKERPGVASVDVDLDAGRVMVAFDSTVARPDALAETVTGLGYGSSVLQVMPAGQYRATTGRDVPAQTAKAGGGCGGCCNRNRN